MPLTAGASLSHYRLVEQIGEGGMGVVWKAVDTTLDREVALKVLPSRFAADPERLARFEREAKAVAALAHPNILSIHGFGRDGDTVFAVTELLTGETLRDRIDAGVLPPRKAAEVCRDIARGLAAAHDKGLVHRDVKPENVFLTEDGAVKILDFGIAAVAASDTPAAETQGATRTSLTSPGMVLGTVDYMSPEQARGDVVDSRSDIFSLGVVLYESLAGARPFRRDTAAETLTAIMREDPDDIGAVGREASAPLERVVERCLEKRPEERFQSARDLAFAIDNAENSRTSGTRVADGGVDLAAPPRKSRGVAWPIAVALLVIGVAVGALATGFLRPTVVESEPLRIRTLTFSGADGWPSAAPDGRVIAFVSQRDGRSRIWIKQFATGGEQPLTDGTDTRPRFSPDGSTVLFLRTEGPVLSVYRQGLVGGQPRRIVPNAMDAVWSPDGTRIAFVRAGTEDGRHVSFVGMADTQDGRETIVLTERDRVLYGLTWSPDGTTLTVFAATQSSATDAFSMLTVDVATGESRLADLDSTTIVSPPVWSGNGELIFARAGGLTGDQGNTLSQMVAYDPVTGRERTLFFAEYLFPNLASISGGLGVEILRPGTMVFGTGSVKENLYEVALDASPRGGDGRSLTRGFGTDREPTYAPDGRRVLFASNRTGNLDLWLYDLESGDLRQVTDDAADDWDPAFTPDGKSVVWSSNRTGSLEIWTAAVDGSAARQVSHDGRDAENPAPHPAGEWLAYWTSNPDRSGVWRVGLDGTAPEHLVKGGFSHPEISPDGRYMTFLSFKLQGLRNVIHTFDLDSGEVLPFTIEVVAPGFSEDVVFGRNRWMPDGKAIAFVGHDEQGRTGILVQDFDPRGADTSATRRPLAGFSDAYITESFGIASDGSRVTIAGVEMSFRLMLAENVPGVLPFASQ